MTALTSASTADFDKLSQEFSTKMTLHLYMLKCVKSILRCIV